MQTTKNTLVALYKAHKHDAKAFLMAFGGYGLEDVHTSAEYIATASQLNYLHENKPALHALMNGFEKTLRNSSHHTSKPTLIQRLIKAANFVGVVQDKSTKLITKLDNHKQALLLENARYRQLRQALTSSQSSMLKCLQEIETLLPLIENAQEHILERVKNRKMRLQQQLTVVEQTVQVIGLSLSQNQAVIDAMAQGLSTGVSAQLVHDMVRKIKAF